MRLIQCPAFQSKRSQKPRSLLCAIRSVMHVYIFLVSRLERGQGSSRAAPLVQRCGKRRGAYHGCAVRVRRRRARVAQRRVESDQAKLKDVPVKESGLQQQRSLSLSLNFQKNGKKSRNLCSLLKNTLLLQTRLWSIGVDLSLGFFVSNFVSLNQVFFVFPCINWTCHSSGIASALTLKKFGLAFVHDKSLTIGWLEGEVCLFISLGVLRICFGYCWRFCAGVWLGGFEYCLWFEDVIIVGYHSTVSFLVVCRGVRVGCCRVDVCWDKSRVKIVAWLVPGGSEGRRDFPPFWCFKLKTEGPEDTQIADANAKSPFFPSCMFVIARFQTQWDSSVSWCNKSFKFSYWTSQK